MGIVLHLLRRSPTHTNTANRYIILLCQWYQFVFLHPVEPTPERDREMTFYMISAYRLGHGRWQKGKSLGGRQLGVFSRGSIFNPCYAIANKFPYNDHVSNGRRNKGACTTDVRERHDGSRSSTAVLKNRVTRYRNPMTGTKITRHASFVRNAAITDDYVG